MTFGVVSEGKKTEDLLLELFLSMTDDEFENFGVILDEMVAGSLSAD